MRIGPAPKKKTRAEPVLSAPANALQCAECSGPMRLLRLVDNATEAQLGLFYGCVRYPHCYCTHSAHPDGSPMGKPANAATRAKRHEAHEVFDKLWKRGGWMTRAAAYRWLSEQFGGEAHMGSMDLEECERVIVMARAKLVELGNERKRIERRRKKEGKFDRSRGSLLLADRQHRAERHQKKVDRRGQKASEPPAAPAPEPEEEPPRLETVNGRSAALETLASLEESSLIVLAEGVRLDDGDDLLEFEDVERAARQSLWRFGPRGRKENGDRER